MSEHIVTKSAVSVTEMSRMVGLSRARFYQLVKKGTFPVSDQDELTKRPCYLEEKQRQILEARRRNCGIDGKPILFYSRRSDLGNTKAANRPVKPSKNGQHTELIDGLAALNVTASIAQVDAMLKELYPSGTNGVNSGEIIRAVFLRIRRQDSGDKQG